jgi:hypothetical protein
MAARLHHETGPQLRCGLRAKASGGHRSRVRTARPHRPGRRAVHLGTAVRGINRQRARRMALWPSPRRSSSTTSSSARFPPAPQPHRAPHSSKAAEVQSFGSQFRCSAARRPASRPRRWQSCRPVPVPQRPGARSPRTGSECAAAVGYPIIAWWVRLGSWVRSAGPLGGIPAA